MHSAESEATQASPDAAKKDQGSAGTTSQPSGGTAQPGTVVKGSPTRMGIHVSRGPAATPALAITEEAGDLPIKGSNTTMGLHGDATEKPKQKSLTKDDDAS